MTTLPGELGTRIRTARAARGLTQKQLADLAGIGKTALFDLEHGNPGVRLRTLTAVLAVLDMGLQLEDPNEPAFRPPAEPAHAPPTPPEPDNLPSHLL